MPPVTCYTGWAKKSKPDNFCNNFVYCAKNYGNWMTVDKVIAKIIWLTFFGPPCKCASVVS